MMKLLRTAAVGILVALIPTITSAQTSFHGVGADPNPNVNTMVTDATRTDDGKIYAVGGSGVPTASLWIRDGAGFVRTPLTFTFSPNQFQPRTPRAISRDGAFIASQTQGPNAPGPPLNPATQDFVATRVTTSPLENINFAPSNLNLNAAPFAAFAHPRSANAISDDGSVLYGAVSVLGASRGVRFDVSLSTSTLIPLPAGVIGGNNSPTTRGTSSDGSVVVGVLSGGSAGIRAYIYDHGTGVSSMIPFLNPGDPLSTRSASRAVSPDGNLVLVSAPTTQAPNGSFYIYNVATGATTDLGSPNTTWGSSGGGLTSDGSVVAVSFSLPVFPATATTFEAWFHNSNGWFHLTSALARGGVDIRADGWTNLNIQGMSRDGRLVYGVGLHNGIAEGFVAEFGPDVLKNFDAPASPPSNTSIVGAWYAPGDPNSPAFVFNDDGTFFLIEVAPDFQPIGGFDRGTYTWIASAGCPSGGAFTFTTRTSTKGDFGTGGEADGQLNLCLEVSGDTASITGAYGPGGVPLTIEMTRVTGAPQSLVGGWIMGNPAVADSSGVLVVLADGTFYFAEDGPGAAADGQDGVEKGTLSWDFISGLVTTTTLVDTTGSRGFSHLPSGVSASLSADGLGLVFSVPGEGVFSARRIVDPATIPVIANTPLSASGVVGQALPYDVDATNTAIFTATGLPDGLSINSGTGVISGAPTVGGQFLVTIFATNTAGVSDIETLTLSIAIPTPVGQNVLVQPVVPEGQGPITLSFGQITSPGTTSVTVVDQSEVPPPGNVEVGGVIYEVTTTATYTGLIQLCFSYAGIDFGTATPRLFHFENNVWVDITTSVDPSTQTICGATTTLSPFAVLVSNVVRTGFYKPVSPIAGFLNIVKGGSTVPLKFNVFVNGVEQTTTAGLMMTVQPISCDSHAPEVSVEPDEVEAESKGKASLRYEPAKKGPKGDGTGQFIQNWKVPKAKGCYMVRMTTEQDGLALTARFKVK